MGPPTDNASRNSRGREDAIETLIDMDPCGAAYRVARTMNGSLASTLQNRPNRITDTALFDAAHALSKYEIPLDSNEVADLYGDIDNGNSNSNSNSSRNEGGESEMLGNNEKMGGRNNNKKNKKLKEGWQTRVLRHHDKIIRAKNNAAGATTAATTPTVSTSTPAAAVSTTTSFANTPSGVTLATVGASTITATKTSTSTTTTATTVDAIPPPALVSALRQIFGTVSDSPDLQDLLLLAASSSNYSPDTNNNKKNGENKDSSSAIVNTCSLLPSLLQTVLNHSVFTGSSSSSSSSSSLSASVLSSVKNGNNNNISGGGDGEEVAQTPRLNIKRDWKSMFDIQNDTTTASASAGANEGGESKEEGDNNNDEDGENSCATSQGGEDYEDDDDDEDGGALEQSNRSTIDNADIHTKTSTMGGDAKSNNEEEEHTTATTTSTSTSPSAANLESILGNACRDIIMHSSSSSSSSSYYGTTTTTTTTTNSRVHGLLIAILSIMTGCLVSEDDLDKLNLGNEVGTSEQHTTSLFRGASSSSSSSSSSSAAACNYYDATVDPFTQMLQVGALLSTLSNNSNNKGNQNSMEETIISKEFILDETVLQYFVEASSTYEERIEIQKANLFSSSQTTTTTTPAGATSSSASKGGNNNNNKKKKKKKGSSTTTTPTIAELLMGGLTPSVVVDSAHHDNDNTNNEDHPNEDNNIAATAPSADESSLPSLLRNVGRSESGLSEAGSSADLGDAAASILLGSIANLVASAEAAQQQDEDDSSDDDNDDDEEEDEHSDDDGEEEEEAALLLRRGDTNEDSDDEEDAHDSDEEDDDIIGGGGDDEELQRALALSLAAALGDEEASGSSSDDGSHDSDNSAATTNAAGEAVGKDSVVRPPSSSVTPPPPPAKNEKSGDTTNEEDNSTPLPPLPVSPSLSLLPSSDRVTNSLEGDNDSEGVGKSNAETPSDEAIFEPSALSSFGKLPASHVLIHLLQAVIGLVQGSSDGNEVESSEESTESPSPFFGLSRSSKKDGEENKEEAAGQNDFSPDSTTASLLIASLHLSSHLRNSAVSSLRDLLSNMDDGKDGGSAVVDTSTRIVGEDDDSGQSIHIESEDPVLPPEKDDPAAGIASAIAASESLETKGMKRKAAAAAQIATLRHETQKKLVEMWRRRVAFYSACCLLNLRCLRVFMGKCLQLGDNPDLGTFTESGTKQEDSTAPVSMSTKTRLGLLALLSNFYSSSMSSSLEELRKSLVHGKSWSDIVLAQKDPKDQFLATSLCNEALHLWGIAIPLLYPNHKARVDMLGNMLSMHKIPLGGNKIETLTWSDDQLQSVKLDIICKRLRVSDMLDFFVAAPMASLEDSGLGNAAPLVSHTPDNSLPTITQLSVIVDRITKEGGNKRSDSNVTKLYFALCQRAISSLLLWGDLSMSSSDANDHDISGGDVGNSGSSGAGYAGSLQLKTNPTRFHFDSAKCADSISVATASSQSPVIANQRATKVWGTVLSTTHFLPKTGIHRWAIKLDKCERGHVFVGVSTARANLKTYVGGDSNGWGLIGTQALWHDRNKIQGDYGATFRTGAVVVVTLDTNVGTLRFGLWKDAAASSAPEQGASAPLSPQALMASPGRRGSAQGAGVPVIEDWGIAFEGLPLDVKLYPAIGLYQRDDRATLYTVSSSNATSSSAKSPISPISSGTIYFPLSKDHKHLSSVRSWNQILCSDGISFATEILSRSIQLLSSTEIPLKKDNVLLSAILPSLASSICLIPSCIPTLSAKYAMELLPLLTRCVKLIDNKIGAAEDGASLGVELKEGTWIVSAEEKSEIELKNSGDSQGYLINIERKPVQNSNTSDTFYHGKTVNTGTSSSKKSCSVIGTSFGTRVQLVEEWGEGDVTTFIDCAKKSTSSFVIDARLSLDGTKFEGIRHNVQKGSADRITGRLQSAVAGVQSQVPQNSTKLWIQTESLLCLAVGHLSLILCSQTSLADIDKEANIFEAKEAISSLLSTSTVISRGMVDRDGNGVRSAIDSIWERCRSADMCTEIAEQWQDSIYFDIFSATEDSPADESMKMEEAKSIIANNPQGDTIAKGSLSRLCPKQYEIAQSNVASVILYHISETQNNKERQVKPEVVLKALQASLQVMENCVREALVSAEASISRKQICEKRCDLSTQVAQFLFEISCTPDDIQSTESIIDDLALIFKSIKSVGDLNYLKHLMDGRTEKIIMRYVGLRSLFLLFQSDDSLEGIRVHCAVESALVSLPRLLSPPETAAGVTSDVSNRFLVAHLASSIAGCGASVQTCVHASIRSLYQKLGSILAMAVDNRSMSLMLGLLANYFVVFHKTECEETILKVLPSLRGIVAHYRDPALGTITDCEQSSPDKTLLDVIQKQRNQRLLRTTAAILMSSTAQLCRYSVRSPEVVELMSEQLVQEIIESVPFVVESTKLIRDECDVEALQSDCATYRGIKPIHATSTDKGDHPQKGLAYLSDHGTLSIQPTSALPESPQTTYFGQLLNVLHVALNDADFIQSMKERADPLFSAFDLPLTDEDQNTQQTGLPLKFRRRILRLVRPLLITMKADSSLISKLFNITGRLADIAQSEANESHSNDELLLVQSAVTLLRYLYTFSNTWRDAIHQNIAVTLETSNPSTTIVSGILAFFGGAPGCLQPGAFVVIEPEIAPPSAGAAPKSSKNSLPGAASIAVNTSSGGAEEIVSGLCRHQALSGVISKVDQRTGACEVIVLGNKSYVSLPPSDGKDSCLGPSRVTIRAVRVSSANVSAADELPLVIDNNNMPTMDVFGPMIKLVESVSSSLKDTDSDEVKELKELQMDADQLMTCAMGLRSSSVLTSQPKLLQVLLSAESSNLRQVLAYALLIASIHTANGSSALSSLPSLEARVWHLLSVRLSVRSRTNKIETTSASSLKQIFEDKKPTTSATSPTVSSAGSKSLRTPPSAMASSFFGSRASRSSSSRETAAASNRREEEENASNSGAERNEDEDEESTDTAAAHLREAAIVQMAELGLPRQWAELALNRVGGTNIEAAVHFCLERGGDMERLLAEEAERRGPSSFLSSRRRGFGASRMGSSNLIRQLVEMGFPRHWCVEALAATRNNVDEALTWILTNGDRLSAEDEAAEEGQEDEDGNEESDDEEEDDNDNNAQTEEIEARQDEDAENQSKAGDAQTEVSENAGWSGVCPVRFVSGRSSINPKTLEITGLPSGGFSSVGTKGVLLTSGKWYYEAEIQTAGCLQIGWADSSFVGHCQADRGDGCGDGPSSWAFDGWRRYRWHSTATEWGCRWSEGDVVGCLVDMDAMSVSFTLNGKGEEIGMGLAFSDEGFRPWGGVYACVSFNRREKLRLILGGEGTEPFKYSPPEGYRGIGEAVHDAVKERAILLAEEKSLAGPVDEKAQELEKKKYLCDFSEGEHGHELFAWQHRYYGSDASVHLGSSRSSLLGGSGGNSKSSKSSTGPGKSDNMTEADISSRLSNIISKGSKPNTPNSESESCDAIINFLQDAYQQIISSVEKELKEVCASLCVLYSQKLVMHTLISYSNDFSLVSFLPNSPDTPWSFAEDAEHEVSRRLWQVLEHCASLQSSGWVGEAGAMAVAAEALGLGISAGDNKPTSIPAGMCSASPDTDNVLLLCGGLTQFLSSAISPEINAGNEFTSTAFTFAACSEKAIGGDVGGSLSFLRSSLQRAVASSTPFRKVLVAAVRKAIRLLAVTEYISDEGASEDDDSELERTKRAESDDSAGNAPDARLVSFLTGILLSKPVSEHLSHAQNIEVRSSLFEGWCIGLLSASAPWRMVCALTAAGILNTCPQALSHATSRIPILADYLGRLESTVLRRTWAERAAVPVCSKYSQALMELLASVKLAKRICPETPLPSYIKVDAATPLPFTLSCGQDESAPDPSECKSWECSEGWIVSNTGWEIWTGVVEIMEVEWKQPPRSIVRTLMDGGEGPPLLRQGCTVMRGVDWPTDEGHENDDGKDLYEKDKLEKEEQRRVAEEEEERKAEEQKQEESNNDEDNAATETDSVDPASEDDPIDLPPPKAKEEPVDSDDSDKKNDKPKKKKKKAVASKLPLGTVLSIESWNGIPAMARRVRWHLSGKEGVYRYGGDGGRFDIIHIETNDKETRVKKKHPPPETLEQCASRNGFGKKRSCNVALRLRNCPLRKGQIGKKEVVCDGILEWPDFGAGIRVECTFYTDGAISIIEREVLYGSKDSGWESRFGQPNFVPGTVMVISPTHTVQGDGDASSAYDELLGSDSFLVKTLRNKEDGGRLRVTTEMRLLRSRQNTKDLDPSLTFSSSQPPPICFDADFHAPSMSLSKDKRSVTCATSDGRGVAFGNVGFTKGIHYWEVKLEKAEIGSVYIGVAEKPSSSTGSPQGNSFGFDSQPRLNRWLGWGFVNFRATYTAGAERVYGAHCHAGDTIGVLLDCDAGRISYFIDGVKYGEHILNDLGCAFENVSPFGFNADGCGSGGAGQGAPSGIDGGRSGRFPANGAVRPKALWPVIGLRHPGDRVTMSSKWMTTYGADGASVVKNALAVDEILCAYERPSSSPSSRLSLPKWFVEESFHEYTRWKSGRWLRSSTRGSGPCRLSYYGLDVDLDTSPFACAAACASIGLPIAFLPGDRIDVKRSAGRILELQEEAVILGAYQGRLFYRLVSQKSEGGSLMEGGGRAWFWDESEAVDGGLQLIGEGLGHSVKLPKLTRFNPSHGGLKVVYVGGAVVRSDLEIFDGSKAGGTIPTGTIIPPNEVLERRLNSCGVARYLIDHEPTGRGWISSRIRGGKEEPIVEILPFEQEDNVSNEPEYTTPEDSAREWHKNYEQAHHLSETEMKRKELSQSLTVESIDEFRELLDLGTIDGMSEFNSDALVAATYGKIADALPHSSVGGCSFLDCAIVLGASHARKHVQDRGLTSSVDAVVHEVATESLVHVIDKLPSTKSLLARISMLRAFNRRATYGMPWLPLRSAQEGSAILGGLSGFGTSLERAGRTWDAKSKSSWVQTPSISTRLRYCREILFTSTKRSFLDIVMDATTTPTPLSHDEYELPREVRTVRVNRLKARRAMACEDSATKKKHSVFFQLQREMRGWSGATLRRGFVAKGHGGQKRAFKVKLVGEGVNDYSGPYREVFTDAMQEVTDLDTFGNSSLGVLQPSANNQSGVGEGRDLFVFAQPPNDSSILNTPNINLDLLSREERDMLNSFSSLTHKKNESSREIDEAISYFGKLVGTACRHGIPVDLPLPLGVIWKHLTEEGMDAATDLKEIDILAYKGAQDEEYKASPTDNILATQRRLLNSFTDGMSSVLPVELLSMFTGNQLRDIVCGNPDIDVELLRRVVEYEGYDETDTVITYFWDVLREMTTSERKLFLQFVWARNRLPLKESDFDAPFKIQKDSKTANGDADYPLPSASTCFFSLTLPDYPEKEILKEKLLFAIENVTTMESDYVTNDVEVSEGWRGL